MSDSSSATVRVGIAGLGRSGWGIHANALAQLGENFTVAAVCDPDKARQDEAIERFDCLAYNTIHELLADEAVELGKLLPVVSQALQEVAGCQKTYAVQFAEHPEHPHVHVHVIPVAADLPAEKRGPGVFGYLGVAEEERISETAMNEIAAGVRKALAVR